MFFEMRFDIGTLDSGERSLPFGLLVSRRVTVTTPNFYLAFQKDRQSCVTIMKSHGALFQTMK